MPLSRRLFLQASALTKSAPALAFDHSEEHSTEKLASNDGKVFRDYDKAPEHVIRFYKEHHEQQTYLFAKEKRQHYSRLEQGRLPAWQMMERLNDIRDNSDRKKLVWAQKLNQFDLYSKSDTRLAENTALAADYKRLVDKYIPGSIRW